MERLRFARFPGDPVAQPLAGGALCATSKPRILVIGDDIRIRTTLGAYVEGFGCEVSVVATWEQARSALLQRSFDLAFTDLGGENGVAVSALLALRPNLSVVILTARVTSDAAVQIKRCGAEGYLPKRFAPAQVGQVIDEVLQRRALRGRLAFAKTYCID